MPLNGCTNLTFLMHFYCVPVSQISTMKFSRASPVWIMNTCASLNFYWSHTIIMMWVPVWYQYHYILLTILCYALPFSALLIHKYMYLFYVNQIDALGVVTRPTGFSFSMLGLVYNFILHIRLLVFPEVLSWWETICTLWECCVNLKINLMGW